MLTPGHRLAAVVLALLAAGHLAAIVLEVLAACCRLQAFRWRRQQASRLHCSTAQVARFSAVQRSATQAVSAFSLQT